MELAITILATASIAAAIAFGIRAFARLRHFDAAVSNARHEAIDRARQGRILDLLARAWDRRKGE